MTAAATALSEAAGRLRLAGVERAEADARLLLCASLGIARAGLIAAPERRLDDAQAAAYRARIVRRCAREPVSRILGRREFWSLEFALDPATFDPRPDSETVIEAVLAWRPDRAAALRILDLGTGSGCLLCALLSEYPAAAGIGTDRAPGAVGTAGANAARLGLADRARFVCANWEDAVAAGRFDVIVANPPYIPRAAIDGLAPEVASFDPRAALDGGEDGLDAYRAVAPRLRRRLARGGAAFVEIGQGQAGPVAAIMVARGLERFVETADLGGIVRCLGLREADGTASVQDIGKQGCPSPSSGSTAKRRP